MIAEKHCRILVVGILLILWIGHLDYGHSGDPSARAAQEGNPSFRRQSIGNPAAENAGAPGGQFVVPYFSAPEQMELCGEPVPLDLMDVRERLDREFTIVVYSHAQVYLWLKRAERYFPWVESQLSANNLPDDLKYVAVAESDLMQSAASAAGAAGPWQFVSATGTRYGLNQAFGLDERYDFELATAGAFRYMSDLFRLFNNWTLAISAYNCGEKRIQDETARQKVSSYYLLKLPQETERYVFRILAIKEVLSHPEKYGYVLPKGAGYPPRQVEQVNLKMPCSVPLQSMAEGMGITYRQLKTLNPAFISDAMPSGSHTVKVPEGKGQGLMESMESIRRSYTPVVTQHKVAKGETLSGIAQHYHVAKEDLREWNRLKGDQVNVGQVIKIQGN